MDIRNLYTLDTETTIRNKIGGNQGSAFCEDNYVVWFGGKHSAAGAVSISNGVHSPTLAKVEKAVLVGHNIKFDLHHLRRYDLGWWEHALEHGVWDTSVAEYLLSAQIQKYPSLDTCAAKYGGTLKDDRLKKDYWSKGIDTTEIPEEIIVPYLENDVLNTEKVAIAQIQEAERLGMTKFITVMMRALLATAEMEWNGLHIDVERLTLVGNDLKKERDLLLDNLKDMVVAECEGFPRDSIMLSSNKQMSSFIFGGEIEYTDQEPVGFFKTGAKAGQPKFKKVTRSKIINIVGATPQEKWLNKLGYYSTSEEVLTSIEGESPFLTGVLRLRWLDKQINTYCDGMVKLINQDGLIHHNLQCTSTKTGRLSCTSPNLQNIPSQGESEIKAYFSSRYGDDGLIVSADYSQLEVVWLAWAAGDEAMKNDIREGVDFHCKRLALKLGEAYEDVVRKCKVEENSKYLEMRKKIKTFSFQRAYGAGARAISIATGMSEKEVKQIISNEERAYPKLAEYYNEIKAEVNRNVSDIPYTTEDNQPLHYGFYTSPTGRRYHFAQSLFTFYDSKQKRRVSRPSFSPTIIKNYPVQGGATGDLVPMMMAVLMYKIKGLDKTHLINQVHDSIMLDIHKDMVHIVCKVVKTELEKAPHYLKRFFDLDFDLPLKVDVEIGKNWKDQETYIGE